MHTSPDVHAINLNFVLKVPNPRTSEFGRVWLMLHFLHVLPIPSAKYGGSCELDFDVMLVLFFPEARYWHERCDVLGYISPQPLKTPS